MHRKIVIITNDRSCFDFVITVRKIMIKLSHWSPRLQSCERVPALERGPPHTFGPISYKESKLIQMSIHPEASFVRLM